MIGAAYLLTAIIAIIIYASRVYTTRTVIAGVGKPYVPIEPEELGKKVRKMVVAQLERSAIVVWESRPRDLYGEILQAEQRGFLPAETESVGRHDYTVGREIPLDPADPPWGDVQHLGWSSPAHHDGNDLPNVQYAPVIAELPNLIEAKAVSLTPPDPNADAADANPMVDAVVADVLRRPENMGMREYLTQLSYLGLINPPSAGQTFLRRYEYARFGGLPINNAEFKSLMSAFADLLSGMTGLSPEIIDQIRIQTGGDTASLKDRQPRSETDSPSSFPRIASSPPRTPESSSMSPATAVSAAPSRTSTPIMTQQSSSKNVIDTAEWPSREEMGDASQAPARSPSTVSSSLESEQSDSGSVVRHRSSIDSG